MLTLVCDVLKHECLECICVFVWMYLYSYEVYLTFLQSSLPVVGSSCYVIPWGQLNANLEALNKSSQTIQTPESR